MTSPRDALRVVLCGYGPLALALLQALHQQTKVSVVGVIDWHDCTEDEASSLTTRLWQTLTQVVHSLMNRNPRQTRLSQLAKTLQLPCLANVTGIVQGKQPAYPRLKELQPDVVICCTWGEKLPAWLLESEVLFLNVHPSYLPQHRGAIPISMGLWQGDTTFGLTLHRMTAEWDAGDILWQTAIHADETMGSVAIQEQVIQQLPHMVQHVFESRQHFDMAVKEAIPQDEVASSFHLSTDVPSSLPFDGTPLTVLQRAIRAKEAWGGLLLTGVLATPIYVTSCQSLPASSTPLHQQREQWLGKKRIYSHYTAWGRIHHLWVYHTQSDSWLKLIL